ncbi:alpha/beta-hydrolase [Lentinus tigrinus ALCF2SS1-6]|uniref:Alpha/beta-hydrolase n=1 Tax=Lentinus tigrinus ALCF2SS1-6 TaxID=1328759 RepID=A0A5C2SIE4_9APHY|nr:alpha/beta-hydrolase [Lentinus tigrinus ALCF2SS1-6]
MEYYKLFILALAYASTVSYAAPSHDGGPQIQWGACDPSVVNDTSLSCGFLEVPLDYQDPSVGKARLALIKANATGERRGSLFFNPGGPGGSGLSSVNENKDLLLGLSGGVYDVISWDPRGVGNLTIPGEIFCFEDLADYAAFFNSTIELTGIEETGNFTDPADIDALLAQAPIMQKKYEEVGQKCLNSPNGKFLKYVGTAAAVRDMVSIANVLDGPSAPINFVGISYGTLIGSWFVNMFPERVGRVILDGVIDPVVFATQEEALVRHFSILVLGSIVSLILAGIATQAFPGSLISTDTIYKALITGCALTGPSGCAIASEGDGPLDIDAKIQALLMAAYDATKLNASIPLTSGDIRIQLFSEMYSPSDWSNFMNEELPQIIQIVNGEAPENTSQGLSRRSKNGIRSNLLAKRNSDQDENLSFTSPAIDCADSVDLRGTTMEEVFKGIISTTQSTAHLFGSSWPILFYRCSFWPVRSVERYQGPFNKTLANKILVVSSILDPATPLPGAETVARLLGTSAVLVRQNGFGHTTNSEPSSCLKDISIAYFTNGTLPANNTLCEVDADFEVFSGVNTADILAQLPSSDV